MNNKSLFKSRELIFTIVYIVFYMTVFSLLEIFVRPTYIIHCAVDDYLPFNEFFVIPYVLWFVYVPIGTLWLMHTDTASFWRLAVVMFGGMTVCLLLYVLFPSAVHLRTHVPNRNILCQMVNYIYMIDTPTNVCPSIHTFNTLCIHGALVHSPSLEGKDVVKHASAIFAILVCLSTVLLKQHSVIDVICAILLFAAMACVVKLAQKPEIRAEAESIDRKI